MSIVLLTLMLVAAYAALKLIIKLGQQRKCLTDREFYGYIHNNVNDDKRRSIRAHISSCAVCEERFLDISLGRKKLSDNDILDR